MNLIELKNILSNVFALVVGVFGDGSNNFDDYIIRWIKRAGKGWGVIHSSRKTIFQA